MLTQQTRQVEQIERGLEREIPDRDVLRHRDPLRLAFAFDDFAQLQVDAIRAGHHVDRLTRLRILPQGLRALFFRWIRSSMISLLISAGVRSLGSEALVVVSLPSSRSA